MSKKDLKKNNAEETVSEAAETVNDQAEESAKEAVELSKNEIGDKPVNAHPYMKKFKYSSMSLIILALVLAIVVVINIMASMLSKRYPLKLDLTPDKRYELSDESIQVLKDLDSDVELTVAMEKDMFNSMSQYYRNMYAQYGINADFPYDMIPNLLEKYSMYAEQGKGSVKIKYVNIEKDPDVVSKYKQYYNGDIESGSIIIYANENVRVISGSDVMNMIQADQASLQSGTPNFVFAGESVLTSAIRNVTDKNSMKVAFIKSMNGQTIYSENDFETLVTTFKQALLEKNGYECEDIDIGTDDLDASKYDLAVIPLPSVDFTENLITKLSDFLYNGGKYGKNLIYLPDISAMNLTNLDAFLEDWSLKVENSLVVDDKNAMGTAYNIMLSVEDSEAVGKLPSDKLPIIAPYAREISILSKNNEDVTKSVLSSMDNSFIADMATGDSDENDRGTHTVIAMSTKEHAEQLDVFRSSVLVIGSSLMVDNEFLTQTNTYNNANVLLGTINNMTGKQAATVIPEKSLQQSYIAATQGQAKAIRIVVQWVIPAIIAVIGIVVLLRRRNR